MTKSTPLTDDLKKYLVPAFERKTKSITAIDVKKFTSYTDTLVIIEGNSHRQVTAISPHLIRRLKEKKMKALGVEGVKEGEWALLDYGDVIIHIFESKIKSFYDLEGFWSDAPIVDLSEFQDAVVPAEETDEH
ncbi:MAG: ribosome silencing factor [Proteobacteria bacterium]|nr:ribosome silencing factor [Pseudomonadota bacterium]